MMEYNSQENQSTINMIKNDFHQQQNVKLRSPFKFYRKITVSPKYKNRKIC